MDLLLSAREAANALRICERTLWQLMKDKEIPCVHIGKRTLYDPNDLKAWIERQKEPLMTK